MTTDNNTHPDGMGAEARLKTCRQHTRCGRCDRRLSDARSVLAGYGPRCRQRMETARSTALLHAAEIGGLTRCFPFEIKQPVWVALVAILDDLGGEHRGSADC